ncbi:PDZ domain-containing protein [Cynara cardunculus var. scolymus]|uniref:PDZ domain-containing protein n=1 Tax=Cynara cardunculus var. scolymus TaxID=59895 RepID=A0A124SC49_CYNCS|nr:PDZ domain-containing protein [Cynara cardunculus var. scolymus]
MVVVMAWNGYMLPPQTEGIVTAPTRRFVGRRKLCFDGISSVCSSSDTHHDDGSISPRPRLFTKTVGEKAFKELGEVTRGFPTTRRMLLTSLLMPLYFPPSRYSSAYALGDPSVTIEQVTPVVIPSGALFPPEVCIKCLCFIASFLPLLEERIVKLFENNTYSVVNIFDVTLRPQLNITGAEMVLELFGMKKGTLSQITMLSAILYQGIQNSEKLLHVVQKNFEGKLIGADRSKDLAVLKVEAPTELLRPMNVGQSSILRVGQQCLAIGNPFGFDHTLTVGVISGLNRDIFSQTGVTIGGGIQTDAAINPGNRDISGCRICHPFLNGGQDSTSVVRAGLNIEIAPDLVANQLNVRNGALVLQVPANSQAARVGLIPTTRGFAGNIVLGDTIVAVNNKPVRNKAEFLKTLDDYSVGDKVQLKLQRGNETLEMLIALEETTS